MRYGVPYKGSKNSIASWVLEHFPKRENLYDLFCGGCAITDVAMRSHRFRHYVINDIDPLPSQLFMDAINGKFRKNAKEWVSREMFESEKAANAYVALCWSFGNNGRDYLYSKDIEPYKAALWNMVVWNNYLTAIHTDIPDELINNMRNAMRRATLFNGYDFEYDPVTIEARMKAAKRMVKYYGAHHPNSFKQLETLERLQSLERIERLQSLERTNLDYRQVTIKPDSLIYCDIPYINTNAYGKSKDVSDFDHEAFYSWAERQTEPVIISEYWMPSDRFTCLDMRLKNGQMCATKTSKVVERLYCPKGQEHYFQRTLFSDLW